MSVEKIIKQYESIQKISLNQHYQGRKICFVILCAEQNGAAVYNGISGLCSLLPTTVVLLGSGYPSDWNKAKSD